MPDGEVADVRVACGQRPQIVLIPNAVFGINVDNMKVGF